MVIHPGTSTRKVYPSWSPRRPPRAEEFKEMNVKCLDATPFDIPRAHSTFPAEETATSQEAAEIAPRYGLSQWRALRFAFHWRLRETLCAGLRCFPGAKSTYKNGEINRSERVTRDDFEFRASRMAS